MIIRFFFIRNFDAANSISINQLQIEHEQSGFRTNCIIVVLCGKCRCAAGPTVTLLHRLYTDIPTPTGHIHAVFWIIRLFLCKSV